MKILERLGGNSGPFIFIRFKKWRPRIDRKNYYADKLCVVIYIQLLVIYFV